MQEMEGILSKLLVADNATILQGTAELRAAFKSANAVPALCLVLSSSNNPQIRQYAAVLLRKRLTKAKNWSKLPLETQTNIKQGILQILVNEKEKFVRNSVAQFIGTVSKHEVTKKNWPELLNLLQNFMTSQNNESMELGIYTLSVMTEICPEAFSNHLDSFSYFFVNSLQSTEYLMSPIGYYTVMTMINLTQYVEANESLKMTYTKTIPQIIQLIKHLAVANDEKACECMQLFDDLSEIAMPVLVPHFKHLVELNLEIAKDKNLTYSIRNKALTLVGWLVRVRKKSVIKHKLIEPIIDVLFVLMSEKPEDEEDENYFPDDDDDGTPTTVATQTLDVLALNLPPEKLITPVLRYIEAGLQGENIYAKKASYLALAMLAEGCADTIRGKYLKSFLECVCNGMRSNVPVIRNAALFALGQFSEHLQPEISQYACELMPILFDYLSNLCTKLKADQKEPPGVDRMFYALEEFCENLEDGLLPYLPTLMDTLLMTLDPRHSVHVQELSLSAIGSTASAAKLHILPYFERIIEKLKFFLMRTHEPETVCLQIESITTLSVLARTLGVEHFGPLAHETMQLGKKLAVEVDDPDLKCAVYDLYGALSTVLKQDMSIYLPHITEMALETMKSTEGFVAHYKDDKDSAFPVYEEELSDTAEEEDITNESDMSDDSADDDDFKVENPYMDEKAGACSTLAEIAKNVGPVFLPCIEKAFPSVIQILKYSHDDIKLSAIDALTQFCISYSKVETDDCKLALKDSLSQVLPALIEVIRTYDERTVVVTALDAISTLLKEVGGAVLEHEGHTEEILSCVRDVLTYKVTCQNQSGGDDDAPGGDDEDDDSEQDDMLMENAGEVIPNLGRLLSPQHFMQILTSLLDLILYKVKRGGAVTQRSYFVGMIAECITIVGEELKVHAVNLLDILIPLAQDENPDVRNNALFGVGELFYHTKDVLYSRYNIVCVLLLQILAKESSGLARDNAVGALAKLIITNISLVPMEEVFPVVVKNLPLKEDFDENCAVLKMLGHMYQMGHQFVKQYLTEVLQLLVTVVHGKQGNEEVIQMGLQLLSMCRNDFTDEYNKILSTLPPPLCYDVTNLINTT